MSLNLAVYWTALMDLILYKGGELMVPQHIPAAPNYIVVFVEIYMTSQISAEPLKEEQSTSRSAIF